METREKDPMTQKKFEELTKIHTLRCVTIYLPTHRYGKEVNEQQDLLLFKDRVRKVRHELEHEHQLSGQEADAYLKPAYDLMENVPFWHDLAEGLAFFLSDEGAETYRMPVAFSTFTFVADHFYLRPLFPYFEKEGHFYILALSEKDVRLMKADRFGFEFLDGKGVIPGRLEEVVGYDHTEKTLQGHSVKGRGTGKVLHGHGEGRDEDKQELEKFFRSVDKGVQELLQKDQQAPLVLAVVKEYAGLYRTVSHYRNLQEEFVKGNPEATDPHRIHEKAYAIVREELGKRKKKCMEQYRDLLDSDRTTYDIENIVPAAVEGRVEALFINEAAHIWGVYDEESRHCRFQEEKTTDNTDLTYLAAIKTFRQGGEVFVLPGHAMPEEETMVNALLRY